MTCDLFYSDPVSGSMRDPDPLADPRAQVGVESLPGFTTIMVWLSIAK